MGYSTEFKGAFKITPPMEPKHINYINAFAQTRRMKRDVEKTKELNDPIREAVELPLGIDGEYFVGSYGKSFYGQNRTPDIINYNDPPETQPSLWCQWNVSLIEYDVANDDIHEPMEMFLIWDQQGKFYCYIEWLEYLIKNFFSKWGYTLSGDVQFQGEDFDDRGTIIVRKNEIEVI